MIITEHFNEIHILQNERSTLFIIIKKQNDGKYVFSQNSSLNNILLNLPE